MALVSEFTWLATPDTSWLSAMLWEFKLDAAFEISPAKVDAEERTDSRNESSAGLVSSEEKELKKLVMSLPILPAVALDVDPEAGVNSAWMLSRAERRVDD